MTTTTIPLSQAKAQLSSLVRQLEDVSARFIIEKRGVPVAKIVPVAGYEVVDVFGSLASYANASKHGQESAAMASVLENKHASHR